jgi:hypothetical protein
LIDTANKSEHSSRFVVSHCPTNQDQKEQKLKHAKFSLPVEAIFKTNNRHMVRMQSSVSREKSGQDRTDLSYMIIASHLMAWNKNRCYVDLSPNFG